MTDALAMFRAAALNPQTVKALCDAYEKPRKSLHDTGQPPIVREVIAERLIRLAEQGARDADRLCEKALAALGNKAVFEKSCNLARDDFATSYIIYCFHP